MYKYILKRIGLSIGILVGISFLIYFILYITPGDPARTKLGTTASEEAVQELRTIYCTIYKLHEECAERRFWDIL